MFYTYVLRSARDNKLYIGSTSDLVTRKKFHDQGRVQSTKNRRPLVLIYYEACLTKEKAEKREKYFKTGFGRGFLKNRI
ncbi:excinuclease ABC subunit C [Candidatus Roizmanbacteria bacterium CG_4_8_14_3_um_filter_34_9]|uniref:Excinuclease ABC subunit C n=3 Tax=Candidatus Roizmaniibacteriota TaxID=1752723 RepID=A0A2M7AV32_9BACT|nr:MAG: excinuclease ABC subunit C [Candidatus Roizmanbacteria bacterium CG07_land_8_20_14_0_80_34_15]PIU74468.1 MAG: excinuclease ABC subunit C [Candidatus Roizmanbacteria bacterium CG06_land_8_20_14_3_00_34_14]PIW73372.1 MAG: excinuclease ABC subunit C [Candidatus Roizmanbacteria bacterium CG_4_8_14_3_um_filter_34_9]